MTACTSPIEVTIRPGLRDRIVVFSGRRGRHGRMGFGRGHFGREFFGEGRKRGRGDIRAAILALLAEQPMHGYQIIQEVTERSSGSWAPSPGSVYPTLQQLEDEELVRVDESAGRRVYQLTDSGREQAAALPAQAPWAMAEGDDDLAALRDSLFQVMAATRQIAQTGGEGELAAAQDVLRAARKQLYRLLAGDEADQAE